jgi:hypothetical protein
VRLRNGSARRAQLARGPMRALEVFRSLRSPQLPPSRRGQGRAGRRQMAAATVNAAGAEQANDRPIAESRFKSLLVGIVAVVAGIVAACGRVEELRLPTK